jgi:glucokinase
MTDAPNLVADLGGTNTRVALADGPALRDGSIRRFRNADHAGLDAVLRAYVAETGVAVLSGACVAVAGPVRDGQAHMTNLDWAMDEALIAHATGARRVALINDLQAQGHALGHIAAEYLREVVAGSGARGDAAQLVIGIGTGFNAAPVHEAAGMRVVAPSECGHITLPVRSADDLALAQHLKAQHGFAAVEEALSGRGLVALHGWLGGRAQDAAGIVAGLDAGETQAEATGRLFARLLGTVTGDLALIHLPFGGIYLIGGVARAFGQHLARLGFAEAFRDKGRFGDFVATFPVRVVEDDYAALTGCAAHLESL